MPMFWYEAYNTSGELQAGSIAAASQHEAFAALRERGLLPVRADIAKPASGISRLTTSLGRLRNLRLADYADLTHELSVLLRAGLSLDEALRLLTGRTSRRAVRDLARNLLKSITAGSALSDALEAHAPTAPAYMANLVRAGEVRGSLGPALAELSEFLRTRVEIQTKIRSALTYPSVLAATALGAISVIIMVLVPALMPLFQDTGAEPPLALAVARDIGALVGGYWHAIALGMALTVGLGLSLIRRPELRLELDRLALRVPLFGTIATTHHVALVARTLGVLLRNGVGLVQALTIVATVAQNQFIAQALLEASEEVRQGRRLALALERSRALPPIAVRFVAIGEESSKLDDMLLHLADMTDKQAEQHIEKALTLLTPALTIVIGIIVGSLVLSVMQAILSVNQLAFR